MNWNDYLIPVNVESTTLDSFGTSVVKFDGNESFKIPQNAKVAIIGVPEDRYSSGAGEQKSPDAVRKQLYALSSGSQGTIVDLGDIKIGNTLSDTYHAIKDLVSHLYSKDIAVALLGGTSDVLYGNYLAMENENAVMTTVSPHLLFPTPDDASDHCHPLSSLMIDRSGLPLHICNLGYQSYYVKQEEIDYFADRLFEAYRLGVVKDGKIASSEPVVRDTDMMLISMNAVKYSNAPAASFNSPNGFSGDEVCQLAFYAGLSFKCKSILVSDMIPANDVNNITAKLVSQIVWYFIEGIKKRYDDHPATDYQNCKNYLIYFDQLHHDLSFFKNNRTERWWVEVPVIADETQKVIIACTAEDYKGASMQEIPDRWWATYHRVN